MNSSRIKRNAHDFRQSNRIVLFIFFAGLIFDALSTVYFMHKVGITGEINPLVRILTQYIGIVAGPLIAALIKAVVCLAITFYYKKFAAVFLASIGLIYFFAGIYNIWSMGPLNNM